MHYIVDNVFVLSEEIPLILVGDYDNAHTSCVYLANVIESMNASNILSTPYWYDFVIEYDFAGTDPTDMAFIF